MKAQKRPAVVCSVCKSTRLRLVTETRTTSTYVCGDCGWLRSVLSEYSASRRGR